MSYSGIPRIGAFLAILFIFAFSGPTLAQEGSGEECAACPPVEIDTLSLCLGDTIYDTTVVIADVVDDTSYTLAITEGPGDLVVVTDSVLTGFYTFVPTEPGVYDVRISLLNEGVEEIYYRYQYVVSMSTPASIEDQYFSAELCNAGDLRSLVLEATDVENDFIFELLNGDGDLDAETGVLTYNPQISGVYEFLVAVTDACGSDTATIVDSVTINQRPITYGFDSTIVLCEPEEICFDVISSDPEGDTVFISLLEGPGEFTQVTDSSGQHCFMPADVDSATYVFVHCYYDVCWPSGVTPPTPPCYADTITITVLLNKPPVIVCPDAQSFFTCEVDTFCFTVDTFDPDLEPMTVNVLSGNATVDGNEVCVIGGESAQFTVDLEVVDACGAADTCSVDVTIEGNRPPMVNTADDFTMSLCGPQTVCFRATAEDLDGDLADIWSNLGEYDPATGQVCFETDTAGIYTVIVSASDSCGATAEDTTLVTLELNDPPTVDAGDDFAVSLCSDSTVCFPITAADDNLESIVSNIGYYDTQTGEVCFYPDTSGVYEIVVTAVDACGAESTDTVLVTVQLPMQPWVNLGDDLSLELCEDSTICIDVETIDLIKELTTTLGEYDPQTGQICFNAAQSGYYEMIVTVTDSCDLVAVDTLAIEIELNSVPVITGLEDTTVYLCSPFEICVPMEVIDVDGNLIDFTVTGGEYRDGSICFIPYDSGNYVLTVYAYDECGAEVWDTATVRVETDLGLELVCPGDTTIFVCELDTLCFPIQGVPEGVDVNVSGINSWYDPATESVCFFAECATENRLVVSFETECGTHSCEFTVTLKCNTPPLVILPQDTSLAACGSQEVCLPIGITDIDNNIDSIIIEGGTYDPARDRVCFDVDSTGIYTLTATVVDSCGARDFDIVYVTVTENHDPELSVYLEDSVFYQCEPEEICIPVEVNDPDGNLMQVVSTLGTYHESAQELCFTPDTAGVYCAEIIAIDICGATDTAEVCVTVEGGLYVDIECPIEPIAIELCGADSVCVPLVVTGEGYTVTASYGVWSDNELCFLADTAGTYNIMVVGEADCNADTCDIEITVTMLDPIVIACPSPVEILLCEPDTLCYEFSVTGPYTELRASAPAYIDGSTVCVPITDNGTYTTWLYADGLCGTDSCSFDIDATLNSPPVVDAEVDTLLLEACELEEICLTIDTSDVDGNLVEVTTSLGTIVGDQVCFTPPQYGGYFIVLTATDACGETDVDTTMIVIQPGDEAVIICPSGPEEFELCAPDTVCILAPITPFDAEITVLPDGVYKEATGEICVWADQSGSFTYTVIADALCGSDTCEIDVVIDLGTPPAITCPDYIDTMLCLVDPVRVCFPVEVTGSDVSVSVQPFGTYANDSVCVQITEPGEYNIEIVATGRCGVDTCITTLDITADSEPTLVLPMDMTFERCPDDTDLVCIAGIYASDLEAEVTLTQVCGPGDFELVGTDSGSVCFLPPDFGDYEFCFEAFDGCNTVSGSFFVTIVEEEDCEVCIWLSLESGDCTPVGVNKQVDMHIRTRDRIGGFDLLLSYDAAVLSFNDATIAGTAIDGWEYFTTRLNSANCGSACPSGLVRFVGIADINNGPVHPPEESLLPDGILISMNFLVANDQNLGDQFLPINFVWYDCGDNSISDETGEQLYIDVRIETPEGLMLWDELDDVLFPESARPFGMGAPDECLGGGKTEPIRCIAFTNGGICVIHPDSIDARGDINLNEVPYEIGDAVLFSNYFVYGLSVFKINLAGQIAASDVNADGLTLSVADLVLLIRVIVGDADPIPKLFPHAEDLLLTTSMADGTATVEVDAPAEIGGAHLVYQLQGDVEIDEIELSSACEGMDLGWSVTDDNQLRLLLWNLGTASVPSGENTLFTIRYRGGGDMNLATSELVDYQGRPFVAKTSTDVTPTTFELHQNYPNPFNPSTTISFTLAEPSDWTLTVYNITGAMVREYSGSGDSGPMSVEWNGQDAQGSSVASGVYLYKLSASSFSDTRKMLLVK